MDKEQLLTFICASISIKVNYKMSIGKLAFTIHRPDKMMFEFYEVYNSNFVCKLLPLLFFMRDVALVN